MFPNLSDRAAAAIAFVVTLVCLILLWILGPLQPVPNVNTPTGSSAQNGGAVSSTR